MEEVRGQVDNIIYRNTDNNYTVFEVVSDGSLITFTGVISEIEEGEYIAAKGEYKIHNSYGEQFQVSEYTIEMPSDVEDIERYLASGAISGIGASLAERIVSRFGEDTFKIIEREPERLAEIKGISERKARDIATQMNEKFGMREVMMYLQKYGISNALAIKIYEKYGMKTYGVIQENPYKISEDIGGIGFQSVDEIARLIGIHSDSDYRIRSGILHILLQASYEGHVYLPENELVNKTAELLGVGCEIILVNISNMVVEKKLMKRVEDEVALIYSSVFYFMELNCARKICELNIQLIKDTEESSEYIDRKVDEVEVKTGMSMEAEQREAVVESLKRGLLIVTGGPGTGKTTIINNMIRIFMEEEMNIVLAAPTGRAAKRMSETTGYEAKTIHRLLELSGGTSDHEGGMKFMKNDENPIETDVIIIDEMSMVDLSLFNALLKAIVPGTRLIMVGDINQLPSVGAGRVLGDLIDSGAIKVIRLNKIFRQSLGSDIVKNAHAVNRGEPIDLKKKSDDFIFLERSDYNVIYKHMIQLILERVPNYIEGKPQDIQVLTPMRKGPLGVIELNKILQRYINPQSSKKEELEFATKLFREGDKVMQIKNNYQIEWEVVGKYGIPVEEGMGAFNGDIGVVVEIKKNERMVKVVYDEIKTVTYFGNQLEEIELAYAVTIHKSQGSEYKAVLIPLLSGPFVLMNRNLLYTAITRAKKCAIILGSSNTVANMISNESENKRYSGLDRQILDLLANV